MAYSTLTLPARAAIFLPVAVAADTAAAQDLALHSTFEELSAHARTQLSRTLPADFSWIDAG
jgi:hypothetical protein